MTKKIPLHRMREISKQRSIRRAYFLPDQSQEPQRTGVCGALNEEWPISRQETCTG
jgi:hypothetical protein